MMKTLLITLFLFVSSGAIAAVPLQENLLVPAVQQTKNSAYVTPIAYTSNGNSLGIHWNPGGFGPKR